MIKPLLAYASEISVQPGHHIEFKVSSELAGIFELEIVRIRCGDDSIGGPGLKQQSIDCELNGSYPARWQPTQVGSFIKVDKQITFGSSFSWQAMIWPTTPVGRDQCLMGCWDESTQSGLYLGLDRLGRLCAKWGDGHGESKSIHTKMPLHERHWARVSLVVDAINNQMTITQEPIDQYSEIANTAACATHSGELLFSNESPFVIAGWNDVSKAGTRAVSGLFNGKIDNPKIYAGKGDSGSLIANWDFSQLMSSEEVVDTSGNGYRGQVVNLPTRAMKGWNHDGTEMNWVHKPEHYGAIHFHEDDLYDCDWQTDVAGLIPSNLASGTYAAFLTQDVFWFYVPFYVRPKKGTRTNDLCLLISTASYYAYVNNQMPVSWGSLLEHSSNCFTELSSADLQLKTHWEHGLSMYDTHSDGSGVCYASRLRPWLKMGPREELWQYNADTHITDWLEQKDIGFDVVTDDDLDREGATLLEGYRCVMTTSHPEYYSKSMMQGLLDYQQQGGRFIYLGGNGFYWRIAYHPGLPGVIEMRRAEDGMRSWIAEPGEYYMSFTGELSGLWRRNGIPPEKICGAGFSSQGFNFGRPYFRTEQSLDHRIAWAFEGINQDEPIGDFGLVFGAAAGSEIDSADYQNGTPPHALIVAEATDFGADFHWVNEELHHAHSAINGENCPHVRCDMVFYETPNNGAVFSMSSIAFAGSLFHNNYQNNVSRLLENVTLGFLDGEKDFNNKK